jgi:Ca-activated chloride channel family protein
MRVARRVHVTHGASDLAGWDFQDLGRLRSVEIPIAVGLDSRVASLVNQGREPANLEFAPDDEVGFWVFSTDLGPEGVPWAEISPVSPLGPKLTELRTAIDGWEAGGGTGLYATVQHATDVMAGAFDASRINGVVVLSDGKNEYPNFDSVDPLIARLSSQPSDRAIRVFCIGYGDDADMNTLERISNASLAAAYDASDPATIDEVFAAVISNF